MSSLEQSMSTVFISQRVAARLKESQNTAAMLTTFQEVDMGNFMEMRHRHKDEFFKKHGLDLHADLKQVPESAA